MTLKQVMRKIKNLVDDTKTAVMATVDKQGQPHMRWMTPVVLEEHPGVIYAVTSPQSNKVGELHVNSRVEWMVQSVSLNSVINVAGSVNQVDNPSLKAQVLEQIADRLKVYWKINNDLDEYVILETIVQEVTYFEPMKGAYEFISIEKE